MLPGEVSSRHPRHTTLPFKARSKLRPMNLTFCRCKWIIWRRAQRRNFWDARIRVEDGGRRAEGRSKRDTIRDPRWRDARLTKVGKRAKHYQCYRSRLYESCSVWRYCNWISEDHEAQKHVMSHLLDPLEPEDRSRREMIMPDCAPGLFRQCSISNRSAMRRSSRGFGIYPRAIELSHATTWKSCRQDKNKVSFTTGQRHECFPQLKC